MTATIVPFPATRRKVFIQGLASAAARYAPAAAERYLESKTQRHRSRLERCGVRAELVQAEIIALRGALIAELSVITSDQRSSVGGTDR
jgi:hypothetical protein